MSWFTRILATAAALFGSSAQADEPLRLNPQNILFSTPTLNDALPNTFADTPPSSSTIIIHEDDWRQFEFVSSSFKPLVDQEIADVDAIWRTKSEKTGEYTAFRELHVRKRIPNPFSTPISSDNFNQLLLGDTSPFTFRDYPKILKEVVAVRDGGFIFYAAIHDKRLYALGIYPETKPALDHDAAMRITKFMKDHDLILIHWPSRTIFDSPASVENYLEGKQVK